MCGHKQRIKPCFICKQPLHEIRIGDRHMPYFVHRGDELERCTAVHPNPASLRLLHRSLQFMAEKRERLKVVFHDDGRVKVHGEHA